MSKKFKEKYSNFSANPFFIDGNLAKFNGSYGVFPQHGRAQKPRKFLSAGRWSVSTAQLKSAEAVTAFISRFRTEAARMKFNVSCMQEASFDLSLCVARRPGCRAIPSRRFPISEKFETPRNSRVIIKAPMRK